MPLFNHITSSPKVLQGKPHIKNSQISVENILEWVADGKSFADLINFEPFLTEDILREALLFAKHKISEKSIKEQLPIITQPKADNSFNIADLCRSYSLEIQKDVDNHLKTMRDEWE